MTSVHLHIPGPPLGKGRAKVAVVGGRARMYTPATTAHWEAFACATVLPQLRDIPQFTGPVLVVIDAHFPRPKKPKHPWPAQKPDADNVAKIVLDALNRTGLWTDDALVVDLCVRKQWAEKGPGSVEVFVSEYKAVFDEF